MSTPLWKPDTTRITTSNMWQFMLSTNQKHHLELQNYADLHDWSVTCPEIFWSDWWDYAGIIAHGKGDTILENGHLMPGARWFPNSHLNYAENLLQYRDQHTALVFCGEDGVRNSISYADLYIRVAQCTAGLQRLQLKPGERVTGFMPNIIDTVVAMLATTSQGGVWSSCSPDFGIQGVLDRFGQIRPRVLFTTDGYRYNGKQFNSLKRVAKITEQIDSIDMVVVCDYLNHQADLTELQQHIGNRAQAFADFIDPSAHHIEFAVMEFADPLYIMYSSGTTGTPKCIVHSIGGTLLQHTKEHSLHTNINRYDTLFFYTTCGWMMWNWLVSGLAQGCTLVLYDGSPFITPAIMMDMIVQEQISVFGTSTKYIAALQKKGVKPALSHDLTSLHTLLTTGSPLAHESYDYVYREIKADLLLASISGGTDIISCFALGCPLLPVYQGQLQCAGLGMAVTVFDDAGQSVIHSKGELVCTHPFPSMPIYFWDDIDNCKYQDAYFNQYDHVWSHGDYAEVTAQQGIIIHGRSDAVLNPGGVRIGTAEIYRQVEQITKVMESIVVSQKWAGDERIILFVVLEQGQALDAGLTNTIKQSIRHNTTPRHVPAKVLQVADIPRTISGKVVELAVRKVIHGEVVTNRDALANPAALELFVNLPALQT